MTKIEKQNIEIILKFIKNEFDSGGNSPFTVLNRIRMKLELMLSGRYK